MKAFTDAMLAELKSSIGPGKSLPHGLMINGGPSSEYVLALIARLEAAERSRQAWWDHVHDLQENTLRSQRLAIEADEAWRKSKG